MYPSARQQLLPKNQQAPVNTSSFKGGSSAIVAQKGIAVLQQQSESQPDDFKSRLGSRGIAEPVAKPEPIAKETKGSNLQKVAA